MRALLALAILAAVPAVAQPRDAACVVANDDVTRMRLGKDRAGSASRIDLPGAVARGDAARSQCSRDDGFMLAYALARIDLSADASRGTREARTAMFNTSVADLEAIRAKVIAGQSDRLEVFNVLGLIYNSTGQPARSLAVTQSAQPFMARMAAPSKQKTLITQGIAQAQLGQSTPAVKSFDQAKSAGSAQADVVRRKILGR